MPGLVLIKVVRMPNIGQHAINWGVIKPLRPLYVGINSTNDNASTAGTMILFSKLIDYDRDSMLVLHKYLEIL